MNDGILCGPAPFPPHLLPLWIVEPQQYPWWQETGERVSVQPFPSSPSHPHSLAHPPSDQGPVWSCLCCSKSTGASRVWAEPLLRFQHRPNVSTSGLDRPPVERLGSAGCSESRPRKVIEPQPFGRSSRRQSRIVKGYPCPKAEKSQTWQECQRENTPAIRDSDVEWRLAIGAE